MIRESQFFVGQTRHVLRADDVPARASIAEGRRRTAGAARQPSWAPTRPTDVRRAYQLLTGLSSHSFSAMRELFGPPRASSPPASTAARP